MRSALRGWPARSSGPCRRGRKNAGLEVSDRSSVRWASDDPDLRAAADHGQLISSEVLAVTMVEGPAEHEDAAVETDLPISLALARA